MKAALGSVLAALAASVCCIGPVAFTLVGAGALSVASTRIEPYRPWLIVATIVLLGFAFHTAYRAKAGPSCAEACNPDSQRTARILAWIAAVIATILIAFPYYISYLT